jgi:hypothetical protein
VPGFSQRQQETVQSVQPHEWIAVDDTVTLVDNAILYAIRFTEVLVKVD